MYRWKYKPQLQNRQGGAASSPQNDTTTPVSKTAKNVSSSAGSATSASGFATIPSSGSISESSASSLISDSRIVPSKSWELQPASTWSDPSCPETDNNWESFGSLNGAPPISPESLHKMLDQAAALALTLPPESSDSESQEGEHQDISDPQDGGEGNPDPTLTLPSPHGSHNETGGPEDIPTLIPVTPPPITSAKDSKSDVNKVPAIKVVEVGTDGGSSPVSSGKSTPRSSKFSSTKSDSTTGDTDNSEEEKEEDFYLRHEQYRRGLLISNGSGSDTDVSEDGSDESVPDPKNPYPSQRLAATTPNGSLGKNRKTTDRLVVASVRPAFRRKVFQQKQSLSSPAPPHTHTASTSVGSQDSSFQPSRVFGHLEDERSEDWSEKPVQHRPGTSSHSFGDQDDHPTSDSSKSASVSSKDSSILFGLTPSMGQNTTSSTPLDIRGEDRGDPMNTRPARRPQAPFLASTLNGHDHARLPQGTGGSQELNRDSSPNSSFESWVHSSPRAPRIPSASSPSTPVLRPNAEAGSSSIHHARLGRSDYSTDHEFTGWSGQPRSRRTVEDTDLGSGLLVEQEFAHQSTAPHRSTPLPYFMRLFHSAPKSISSADSIPGEATSTPKAASGLAGNPHFALATSRSSHHNPHSAQNDLVDPANDSVVEEDLRFQGQSSFRRRKRDSLPGSNGYSSSSSVGSVGDGRFGGGSSGSGSRDRSGSNSGGYSPLGPGGREFLLLPHSDSSSFMLGNGSHSGSTSSSPKHASGFGGFRSQQPSSASHPATGLSGSPIPPHVHRESQKPSAGNYMNQSSEHHNHHCQPPYSASSSRRPGGPAQGLVGHSYSESFQNRFSTPLHSDSSSSGGWTDGPVEIPELDQGPPLGMDWNTMRYRPPPAHHHHHHHQHHPQHPPPGHSQRYRHFPLGAPSQAQASSSVPPGFSAPPGGSNHHHHPFSRPGIFQKSSPGPPELRKLPGREYSSLQLLADYEGFM